MNIETIEAFVYVNHYGSFNKAADVLFLSQPSVTARIQTLERELDCRLFDRLGKQILLTDKGKQFLPYALQILKTYQKGKLHIQQRKTVPHELRIGCTVSVSNYLMPEILPGLKRKFPEIKFKLTTATTDELVHKLLNKEIDVGFVRKVVHPTIRSVHFYDDPIRLYVYEDHPFNGEGQITIDAVCNQPLIFFECGSLDWMRIHRAFESLEQPPRIEYQLDNSEAAKKLVLKKAGICFLPGLCVHQEVREKQLFPIDIPEITGVSLQTSLISLHGENAVFIDSLLELGQELTCLKTFL